MYGNSGAGLSDVDGGFGKTTQYGVTVSYSSVLIKFGRTAAKPISLLGSSNETFTATSYLVGYSYHLVPEFHITGKIGVGSVENHLLGFMNDDDYGWITQKGRSIATEFGFDVMPFNYIGFYFTTFINVNRFRDSYGATIGINFGYL